MHLPRRAALACLLFLPAALVAELVLAPPFREGAVLQRDLPLPVWGRAGAGTTVTVAFGGSTVTAVADELGAWRATLPPQPASAEPRELVVAAEEERLVVGDAVVGEVWLASGQSNMAWRIESTRAEEKAFAAEPRPLVREFTAERVVSEVPAFGNGGTWRKAVPGTVEGMGAVSYHFARRLHDELGVPVGILLGAWGGTPIESWLPPETIADEPAFHGILARWHRELARFPAREARYRIDLAAWESRRDAARAAGERFPEAAPRAPVGPGHSRTPSGLHNAMIEPLVPFAIRGFLWYQGESNVGRHGEYAVQFPALVRSWRSRFGGGDSMPFLYVQIAPYPGSSEEARRNARQGAQLREAQARALALPGVGEAVILDLGTANDIHPRTKRPVGERLALLALAGTYGIEGLPVAPRLASARREGSTWVLEFSEARALAAADPAAVEGFEVAGAEGYLEPATARIEGTRVIVQAPTSVPEPVRVAYAFRSWVTGDLKDDEGLPVNQFRIDERQAP